MAAVNAVFILQANAFFVPPAFLRFDLAVYTLAVLANEYPLTGS